MSQSPKQHIQLSTLGEDALLLTAMVVEIIRADKWRSVEECLKESPSEADNYINFAVASLRALRQLNAEKPCRQ